MDLSTVNDFMLTDYVHSMFTFTAVASRNKGTTVRTRRNETSPDTRPTPPQLYDNEDYKFRMPTQMYSALMGFLVNQGTAFLDSPYPVTFPDQKRLRFSSADITFLEFIQTYFEGYFFYDVGITYLNGPNGTPAMQTITTPLIKHLYNVWYDDDGSRILPDHFEQYFTWDTLAFWIMRNGFISGATLRIGVSTLGMQDKLRVQAVLKDKFDVSSTVTTNGDMLNIHDYSSWVHNVKPLIHESQLHRLVKKPRKKTTS